MKILYIGDIYSSSALDYLEQNLEKIKKDNNINIVLCNGENVTHGRGLSYKHYIRLKKLGIAGITMGNHTYSNQEIYDYINDATIARPANLNTKDGQEYLVINYNGQKILLINVLGRVYMNNTPLENPFTTCERIIDSVEHDYAIVDVHAEATSEKIALAYYLDGSVDAVLGTHTHVPTADERRLPNNTLFISDIGMTGPKDGIIGDDKDVIIERFISGVYKRSQPSNSPIMFNAVVLDINKTDNKIKRINL